MFDATKVPFCRARELLLSAKQPSRLYVPTVAGTVGEVFGAPAVVGDAAPVLVPVGAGPAAPVDDTVGEIDVPPVPGPPTQPFVPHVLPAGHTPQATPKGTLSAVAGAADRILGVALAMAATSLGATNIAWNVSGSKAHHDNPAFGAQAKIPPKSMQESLTDIWYPQDNSGYRSRRGILARTRCRMK